MTITPKTTPIDLSSHIIEYPKGKTSEYVPTIKIGLGQGFYSIVHEHRQNPEWAVKKQNNFCRLLNDFKIGMELDCPYFMKVYKLYVKVYPDGFKKDKMVMEKVTGNKLHFTNLTKEESISLFGQLKTCMEHLYDHEIVWDDVTPHNVFVTEERNLKIIDFGAWYFEKDIVARVRNLIQETPINLVLNANGVKGDTIIKNAKDRVFQNPDLKREDLGAYIDAVVGEYKANFP